MFNVVKNAFCQVCSRESSCDRQTCIFNEKCLKTFSEFRVFDFESDSDFYASSEAIRNTICKNCEYHTLECDVFDEDSDEKHPCMFFSLDGCGLRHADLAIAYINDKYRSSQKRFDYTTLEAAKTHRKSTIQDSGDRTEFESGAVRDCAAGKGRCDLLPLKEVKFWLSWDDSVEVLDGISYFQASANVFELYSVLNGFMEEWLIGYVSNDDDASEKKYTAILEVAKHFEDGATKYGENNWRKGIPVYRYIDSAIRHYIKYKRGDYDERHDRAFIWNILCAIWTCDYIPNLNNYDKKYEMKAANFTEQANE